MQNRRDGRAVRDHTVTTTSPNFAVESATTLNQTSARRGSGFLAAAVLCWPLSEQTLEEANCPGFSSHSTSAHLQPECPLGIKGGTDRRKG